MDMGKVMAVVEDEIELRDVGGVRVDISNDLFTGEDTDIGPGPELEPKPHTGPEPDTGAPSLE